MKTLLWPAILASLALNLALAGWLTLRQPDPAETPAPAVSSLPRQATAAPAGYWTNLGQTDPAEQIARLRGAGFPSEIVRAIIAAQLQEEMNQRRQAIEDEAGEQPFWKRDPRNPRVMAAQLELSREYQRKMREYFGPEALSGDMMSQYMAMQRFGPLPPEKMDQVQEVSRRFGDMRNELFNASGGVLGAAMSQRMQAIETEERAELVKLLSPQELEQYDFRNNRAAMQVRMVTSAMDLSEPEFRALYQLHENSEAMELSAGPPAPDQMQRRMEAQRQLDEQIKATLGSARYEEYQRARQPDYRNTKLLADRLELPPDTAQQIWAVREATMQKAAALRGNRSLSPEQLTQQTAVLQQEARSLITPLMGGPRNYETYEQYGGAWMQRLNPVPRPASRN